jgi:hypothetical protein
MQRSVADVLARLRAEGLQTPTDDAARDALRPELAEHMPIYLRVVVGIAAWFATGFLLFSIIAVAGLEGEIARIVVGASFIAGAILLRQQTTTEFMRWGAIAMALSGQGLIVAGVAEMTDSPTSAAIACLAISVLLILLVRDFVLRFLATVSGAGSLLVALVAMEAPQGYDVATVLLVAAAAWAWRANLTRRTDAMDEMAEPVRYGLIASLFGAMLVRTFAVTGRSSFMLGPGRSFTELGPLATIGCTLALVVLVWKILDEHNVALNGTISFALLAGAVAFGFGTLDSPGVVAGVTVVALAFDRRDRALLAMATVFLLTFLAMYYYSLDLTLLQKAGVLSASGLLLLAVRSRVVARNDA